MSATHKTVDQKLGDLVRRLATNHDGELLPCMRSGGR